MRNACRLYAYGLGIHLIRGEPLHVPSKINPLADHLSFQVSFYFDTCTWCACTMASIRKCAHCLLFLLFLSLLISARHCSALRFILVFIS